MEKQSKLKKTFAVMGAAVAALFSSTIAFAADTDPKQAMKQLQTFLLDMVTIIGVIALIWGGVQLALALKSQDASQRTQAILYLAGGAIMVGIKAVLTAMGVSVG